MPSSVDEIHYYHLPEWQGVELCLAAGVTEPAPPQFHDWLEIRLIRRGSATIWIGKSQYQLQPGSLAVIRPGEFCSVRITGESCLSFLGLCIEPRLLSGSDHAPLVSSESACSARPAVFSDRTLRALLLIVQRVMTQGASAQNRQAVLRQLITELVRRGMGAVSVHETTNPDGEHPPPIRRAVAFLREHSQQDISLRDLAATAGLSRFHFLRLFSANLGVTPHRYQLLLRVARARALLRSGVEIADAAVASGFADQSHLTRCFHSVIGVSPRRFQQCVISRGPVSEGNDTGDAPRSSAISFKTRAQ